MRTGWTRWTHARFLGFCEGFVSFRVGRNHDVRGRHSLIPFRLVLFACGNLSRCPRRSPAPPSISGRSGAVGTGGSSLDLGLLLANARFQSTKHAGVRVATRLDAMGWQNTPLERLAEPAM